MMSLHGKYKITVHTMVLRSILGPAQTLVGPQNNYELF
jgi:hypothetical protein